MVNCSVCGTSLTKKTVKFGITMHDLNRQQFSEIIWHVNYHVNDDHLRRMEDLWVWLEDPVDGFARRERYWAFNMNTHIVTNLNGHGSGMSCESWDLALGQPVTPQELIQNQEEGYTRPAQLVDCEDEESDHAYKERSFAHWVF
ncbi:hypothetical protein FQA39_LY09822 [Lamprigera yunnana]|nr:hypothetical protein FQA39_LY09822 [Lamprigera yunnana]